MRPAPRTARPPRQAPPARLPVRREFSPEDQADIQQTALVRMWRSKGIHVRAYELDGVLRFERVAEVVPLRPAAPDPAPVADPILAAIESTRRRWQGYRESRADVGAIREALRRSFPGREAFVMPVAGYPGVVRIFVATARGWRSRYANDLDDVQAFAIAYGAQA